MGTAFIQSISSLADEEVSEFINKLDVLCKKYETTFSEVEDQIFETEKSLKGMLAELTGNDFDMQGINELKKLLGDESNE